MLCVLLVHLLSVCVRSAVCVTCAPAVCMCAQDKHKTNIISTRQYRAPEVLLPPQKLWLGPVEKRWLAPCPAIAGEPLAPAPIASCKLDCALCPPREGMVRLGTAGRGRSRYAA